MILGVLLHQGIGLDAFNALPMGRAVHALYEICNAVTMAAELAAARPYPDHDALFRQADAVLFALPEANIDIILDSHPHVGARPGSRRSHCEQCAVCDPSPSMMADLQAAADRYEHRFGFPFVMYVDGASAAEVIATIGDRMHHDPETERKVLRNELALIHRSRLQRLLGPEGGYQNWW